MVEDGDGHNNNVLTPDESSTNNTVKSETGISATTNIINVPSTNITVYNQGNTHLKPQQIKVYYWIQVFSSYITQDLSGKLSVVVSSQSCNNTNTDINISELSTTLMQQISTKIIDYLQPQVQVITTDIDTHNTQIENIKEQIDSINIAIQNLNSQYSQLIAQLNNKLNALTINIAEPLNQFINIDLIPQYETGNTNTVNSNLNISLNTNIPTGIVKIIDNETYQMFDTKACSAAISLTSYYTETGE